MSIIEIDRAIHELRTGRFVKIDGQVFVHPEFINNDNWPELSKKNPKLIITAKRASAFLGKNFEQSVLVDISQKDVDFISLLTAGVGEIEEVEAIDNNEEAIESALRLARLATLLPAMVLVKDVSCEIEVSSEDITNFKSEINRGLKLVADTKLHLRHAKSGASIKAFRPANGGSEHLAIIIGEPSEEPIIRVHSSCYTGDLLGSLTCDCGDQLSACIKLMDKKGGGIILYLMQEGRGIGLINKLHAYNLQHGGMDTVEANEFLGFDDEEREFEPAALMLKEMNISTVELVSNNPKKAKGLEELGITVKNLVPLVITHKHNHEYLQTKAEKSGHLISTNQNS